jgi:hypothetical protein
MISWLVLLAFRASFNVCFNPFSQVWPPEDPFHHFYGTVSSWMACCGRIMVSLQDGSFQGFLWWYDDATLHCPKSVLFLRSMVFFPFLHELGVFLLPNQDLLFQF